MVPEDAPTAALELIESVEIQPAEVAVCKIRVKYDDLKLVKCSDVMVWSEETGNFVIGRTLASVDEKGNIFATLLNLSEEPLK